MAKIQKLSDIQQEISFTECDFYHRYEESFKSSELGRIKSLLPLGEMAISFGLVEENPKNLRTQRGRKPFFTLEGKVALVFLKMHTGPSAQKLMEALNGNIHYQIVCGIRICPESQLTNYKLIDNILLELSKKLKIQEQQKILADAWKPYMKNLDTVYTDASCYESLMRFPTDVKLLMECVERAHKMMCSISVRLGERRMRTKYNDIEKANLAYRKQRKHTHKQTRKMIMRLLSLLEKILCEIRRQMRVHPNEELLNDKHLDMLEIITRVYRQQKNHFNSGDSCESIPNRIVSVSKPYVFVEERNGTWNTPYLFNGKELDEETGLYYYGARYLDPTGAMWLSVDPLFEKYVGMSPYNYCAGNPVKLVDVDGEAPWILIAAGIGAAVSGGIALVQGKSLKEVGAAALGGAVCGAVAACGGVFFEGSVVAGVVSGALGGGLGDATEQGINIATGNQKEYDGIKTVKAGIVGGVVNGVATRYVNGVKSSAKKELDNAMEQKIPSQSEVDAEFLKAFDVPKKFVNKGNHSQWKTNHDNYLHLRKTALNQAKENRTSKILDKSVKINNAQTSVTYSKSKYFGGVVETVNDLTQVGTNNVINE